VLNDLNELESGQELQTDLVIVGAGAAGISIALEFVGSPHQVLLVESGGMDADGDTLSLSEGSVVGMAYEPLEASRARHFGGTTNMWTGWCKPLDPIDFRRRSWLDLPGWPVSREELDPFYVRAQDLVEAGPYRYDLAQWLEAVGEVDDLSAARLEQTFWQKSPPTRFGQRYLEPLRTAKNISVLLHANLTGLQINGDQGLVESVRLRTLQGESATVRARCVVIACGGLENPRLLLSAAPARPRGLGNDHDLVGRYFMEHPWFEAGWILPTETYTLIDRYYRHDAAGRQHRTAWQFTEHEQERLGVLNCCISLGIEAHRQGAVQAAGKVWRDLSHGKFPTEIGDRVVAMLSDIHGISESVIRKLLLHRRVNKPPERLELHAVLDPKPNPDSRVTLSREGDALGLPRLQLDWRLSADDEHSMALLVRRVADEITRLGHGRVRLHPALQDPNGGWARAGNLIGHGVAPDAPTMHISWHHMGTTRMAQSPHEGVVDADCRVHGTANLYVAGSSVFPTSGNANPTLTIVALALRLADHLQQHGLTPGRLPSDGTPALEQPDQLVAPLPDDPVVEG
jgi:choline dehydrogenase-like flavoprotein